MKNPRRVVITGLGVIAPNGIGKDTFWQNLVAGKSGIDYITAFDPSPYPCHVAGEVRDFDPKAFMTARRAKPMGRFSQFAVAATRLALEDAKVNIDTTLSSSTSIFYGTSINGGGDIAARALEGLIREGVSAINPWAALEYPPHATSSYIAIEFGITGPALSLSSNCCTGIDAINEGFKHVSEGLSDMAVVGGCDAPIFPLAFGAFCALGALTKRNDAPRKASRPYDLQRDGIVISEGAATLVLEELDVARERGARIYGEVLGHGSASEAIGMRKGDLSGKRMASAISDAIRQAGLVAEDIDHVNAHGSSLPDYDICDTNAFKEALGTHAYKIPISSIKSMMGQPVSAAGTIQAAAACLSLREQVVPPTINQETPDPRCDLDYVPNVSRVARVRTVLINGHSFGGSVAALVVGQTPP
ncbi:MAG TPA: beta-ketoacyl-[acyl-carrier-protein] synthase family protein [Methylomirabilota bacterium]|jgi:3-oxoacyl-[acyl-carrier-protein] synthase II|nr:beta-ketoacyl-[acyl-carrier-protein] synthase family protein [Methylomirabilota bacterium]